MSDTEAGITPAHFKWTYDKEYRNDLRTAKKFAEDLILNNQWQDYLP